MLILYKSDNNPQIFSSSAQILYRMYHFIGGETKLKNASMLKIHKAIMEPEPRVELILLPTVGVQISQSDSFLRA